MTRERKDLGKCAEGMARDLLKGKGYRILEENYACPLGEIDLIASEKGVLSFIEVRSRKGSESPAASINIAKQRRIVKVAQYFLSQKGWEGDCRFDVVAVQISPEGKMERMELIRDAFDQEGVETFGP